MLLRKIDQTSSVSRKPGSGRPRSVRSDLSIQLVTDLICSQEDAPGTGKSPREIEKEIGISRSSVRRIAQRDVQLRVLKRKKAHLLSDADRKTRLERCRLLLRRRALQHVHKIWFSDEKIFTVQPPINTQNDRLNDTAEKKSAVPSTRLVKGRNISVSTLWCLWLYQSLEKLTYILLIKEQRFVVHTIKTFC